MTVKPNTAKFEHKYLVLELDTYDLRTIVQSPGWPAFKTQMAAWGIVPHLLEMGDEIRGVELGVSWGLNSYMLLENCPNLVMLTGVDHFLSYMDWDRLIDQEEQDHNYTKLLYNMDLMGPRFSLVRESTVNASIDLDNESQDFVFVDADHSMKAVLKDLDHYWPKLKPGGIMAGHDSNLFGVNFAVTSWAKHHGIDPASIETEANSAWWFRKP